MSEVMREKIISALVNQELEATSWESLKSLAAKQIENELYNKSVTEIETLAAQHLNWLDNNIKRVIKKLVDVTLAKSNPLQIMSYASKILIDEYSMITNTDLLSLHRMFLKNTEEATDKTSISIVLKKTG
ncbi:MAG: hypothetical protein CME71_04335 [Halobacteriovorax sp.]|nr:hypothetical protein [Halobacteriovorax sp.]